MCISLTKNACPQLQDRGHVEYSSVREMLSIDVYSFGIVLWEMATRHQPYEGLSRSKFAIVAAVREGKRPTNVHGGMLAWADPLASRHSESEVEAEADIRDMYCDLMTECWSTTPSSR